ncbi:MULTISPECIES: hypothetical protein [unclassified Roseateles]|uniref:hypothetical protein n=1 Tax=unclassified Roseateles TaxID=2626991 RepID=UPI0006FB3083|nr:MULTISPECIES: hypothetical protein [unclassified Roseateles]KQW42185.1 hypothetical protein ASC81_20130 [Pelomonas sp. Root405]KRA68058.1 hypothetical protein ASD88_21710 [Pelomonas sp. Root662]
MNWGLHNALVLNEWRLRSRRVSSLVILLAVVALSWLMVLDPQSGAAMMVTGKQRVAYESEALAFATTLIASLLFGLAGFYLARGRSQEDLRTGTAAVLAATPVSNAQLLGARWLGAFGFLMTLGVVVMLTIWVLQLVRGEGPLQPLPYLQMLVLGLAPGLMLCASLAVLSDAWAPLMGKRGDALYWLLWMAQFAFIPAALGQGGPVTLSGWQVFDINGVSPLLVSISRLMDVTSMSVGGGPFDATLPVLHMPEGLWTRELVALRLGSMLLALLPLWPAALLFHRYAPDRVKLRSAGGRWQLVRALLWLLQPVMRPFNRGLGLLMRVAARLPGVPGRWLADVGLVLLSQPLLALVMLGCAVASAFVPAEHLPGLLAVVLGAWGMAMADVSSRDLQSGTLALASAAPGGALERGWRQALAALGIGLLVAAPALLRWSSDAPLRALACGAGLLFLSPAAALLGRLTHGSRTFLALFLFALYLNLQKTGIGALDLLGLSGDAHWGSVAGFALAGALGFAGLLALPRWRRT